MQTRMNFSLAAVALAALIGLAGCDDATGPGAAKPVSLTIGLGAGVPGAAPALFAGGYTLSDGANTLVIESAEVVLRDVEFERLGDDACDDGITDADDTCEEFDAGPMVVDLPLDGSVGRQITALIDPGTYDEIEFEVHKLDDTDPSDAALLAQRPELAQISVQVTGTFNDAAFSFASDLNEEQKIVLTSPLEVTDASGPVNATLVIDLSSWFSAPGGALVDPSTANKGGVNENMVRDNIRTSIEGFRDDDADGQPHDSDSDE